MIRWKYVIPRLVLLAIVVLSLTFGSGPLLHWSLVTAGQTAVGAKVEISNVDARWWQGSVALESIAVADPQHPMQNLFEADSMVFDMDTSHLLRKRFVVEKAEMTGVRFGTERTTSGALEPTAESSEPSWTDAWTESAVTAADERFEDWLDEIQTAGLQKLQTELETVQLAEEMARRWPQEYNQVRGRVTAIEERVQRLKSVVERPNTNPLRLAQLLTEATTDVQNTLKDIETLKQDFKRLSAQIPADRQALMAAQERDRAKLKSMVRLPKIDGATITRSVFGAEQGEQVLEAVEWVKWIQQVVPNPDTDFVAERSQGVDVQFSGVAQQPLFWLQEAEINGLLPGRRGSDPIPFSGSLQDLTSHPSRLARPLILDLNLQGEQPTHLLATIDRTTPIKRDHLIVELPSVKMPERDFGKADSLAMAIPSGTASIRIDLTLVGDQIDGTIDIRRDSGVVEVRHVAERLGGTYVHGVLGTALERVNQFEATITLSGTLKEPKLDLESPIGPELADALNVAVAGVVDDQLRRAEQKLDEELAKQMAKLEERVGDVSGLETILNGYRGQLTSLKDSVARVTGFGRLR